MLRRLQRCYHSELVTVTFDYRQSDIQKSFDTLYNNQRVSPGLYLGFIEQALAISPRNTAPKDTITQDVVSSMYLNRYTGNYDCVTTTTFCLKDGNISTAGIFHLTPDDTIAPPIMISLLPVVAERTAISMAPIPVNIRMEYTMLSCITINLSETRSKIFTYPCGQHGYCQTEF